MLPRFFKSRELRDAEWRKMLADGLDVVRRTSRNQILHPMYVEDAPSGDTGPGNTDYQRQWSRLYAIDEKP